MNYEQLMNYYYQHAQEAESGQEQENYLKAAEKMEMKIQGKENKPSKTSANQKFQKWNLILRKSIFNF